MTARPRTGPGAAHDGYVHEAVIYDADDQVLETVVPFVHDGIAAGEPTIVCLDPRYRLPVLDALGEASEHVLGGLTYADPYDAMERTYATVRSLVDHGATQVRAIAHVPAEAAGWHGWSRYEAAITHFVGPLPVWGICLYDSRTTAEEVLSDVKRTHTHLGTRQGGHEPNRLFQDPGDFLAERARRDIDPLEDAPPQLDLHLPPPWQARRRIDALAQHAGLERAKRLSLGLAVVEVVTNAVEHGRPPIRVRAWQQPGHVVVAIDDRGQGPAEPFAAFRRRTGARAHPFGLYLAHKVCDTVTLERRPHGFTVHLVVRNH